MEYKTHVYTHYSLPADILQQYGEERYKCFQPDDPYVNLDHKNKTEFDKFDAGVSSPLYLVVTADDGPGHGSRLVTCSRFISTMEEYDLEADSWSYMTNGIQLPKAPHICENTRLVTKSSNTLEGMIANGLMIMKMCELCRSYGYTRVLGVTPVVGVEWVQKRGGNIETIGTPYHSERDQYPLIIAMSHIDSAHFDMGLNIFKLGLGQRAISQISVAA